MKGTGGILIAFGAILLMKSKRGGATPTPSQNVRAFLDAIQYAEGTFSRTDPYRVTFAYSHTVSDLSDHPANTGEWGGYPLSASTCENAGFPPGCVTTAAGAYQFLLPTWNNIKDRRTGIRFDANGQDQGALLLISDRGALSDIEAGRFETAIYKLNTVWASLPGSPYGQPTRTITELKAFYQQQGGII